MWILEKQKDTRYFHLETENPVRCYFTTRLYREGNELKKDLSIDSLVRLNQVHSNKVFYVDNRDIENIRDGDGMFTTKSNLYLEIVVADCLPIYFWNSDSRLVGICHSGWRGTVKEIAKNMVDTVNVETGIPSEELNFAFGPCIGPCCYEVGDDVVEAFRSKFDMWRSLFHRMKEKIFLDLRKANREMLLNMGLHESGSIELCTFCARELFFSSRRDRTAERNRAIIGCRM